MSATVYPTSKDTFTTLSCSTTTNPYVIINVLQDGMAAVQTVLGITGSADTTSITYKLSGVGAADKAASLTGVETLTNKTITLPIVTVKDNQFTLQATGDITKQAQFSLSGITAGQTRTWTYPDVSDTFVGRSDSAIIFKGPQGFATNYTISKSVASSNLTVALKDINGSDATSASPIPIRIGNTVRTVTAALSNAKLIAGTNWMNLGATELAAKDLDIFIYAIWNTTTTPAVYLGISRLPCIKVFSDSTNTSTSARYMSFSGANTPGATDECELIGRINVTLGVSASYLWTLPATARDFSCPIYETRWFSFTPTIGIIGAGTAPTYTGGGTGGRARICHFHADVDFTMQNTAGGTAGSGAGVVSYTLPIEGVVTGVSEAPIGSGQYFNNAAGEIGVTHMATTLLGRVVRSSTAFVTGADQNNATRFFIASGRYPLL